MFRVDAWADDRTWSGWAANRVLYYPSTNLRLRDTTREIRRLETRAQIDADQLTAEEARAKARFKAAAAKGAHREELKHLARIISNVAARRRMRLKHQQQYQAALQEIENVKALKDQTEQMNKLARICRRINVTIPMSAAAALERDYSKAKMEISAKAEMMSDILEDEDEESENKERDADALVDRYLHEFNISLAGVAVPSAAPGAAASSARDEECIRRINALGVP